MSSTPERKLGAYEIVAPIGQDGMGEVYHARDIHWDVSPDGRSFAMIRLDDVSRPRQIRVILNWSTALAHRDR